MEGTEEEVKRGWEEGREEERKVRAKSEEMKGRIKGKEAVEGKRAKVERKGKGWSGGMRRERKEEERVRGKREGSV